MNFMGVICNGRDEMCHANGRLRWKTGGGEVVDVFVHVIIPLGGGCCCTIDAFDVDVQ